MTTPLSPFSSARKDDEKTADVLAKASPVVRAQLVAQAQIEDFCAKRDIVSLDRQITFLNDACGSGHTVADALAEKDPQRLFGMLELVLSKIDKDHAKGVEALFCKTEGITRELKKYTNLQGENVLHVAAATNDYALGIVKFLISHNMPLTGKTKAGETALTIAMHHKNSKVVEYLLDEYLAQFDNVRHEECISNSTGTLKYTPYSNTTAASSSALSQLYNDIGQSKNCSDKDIQDVISYLLKAGSDFTECINDREYPGNSIPSLLLIRESGGPSALLDYVFTHFKTQHALARQAFETNWNHKTYKTALEFVLDGSFNKYRMAYALKLIKHFSLEYMWKEAGKTTRELCEKSTIGKLILSEMSKDSSQSTASTQAT